MSGFDSAAQGYDQEFSHSCVGKAQRAQVYDALIKDGLTNGQKVLELNCGTGIDANQFAKWGNTIVATDNSEGMINTAKSRFPEVEFQKLDFKSIGTVEGKHTLLFSNFGGLNCLSPTELKEFIQASGQKLESGGHLVMVIMGKKCCWERFYFFMKGQWSKMKRRNTLDPIEVPVGSETIQTWYHSPKEVKRMLGEQYSMKQQKPIGLYVPPSYLAPFFEKRSWLFSLLTFHDSFLRFPFMSNYADHYYISLQKK